MNCPVCPDTQLQMTERQGVEIDYCPKCRGVWLDRGELDKIIDRASPEFPAATQQPASQQQVPPPPPQPQQHQQGPLYQPQSAPPNAPPPPGYSQQGQPQYNQQQYDQQQYRRKPDDSDYKFRYPQQGGHYKKRKSILSDIFDF